VWIAADALLTVAMVAYWANGMENAGVLALVQAATPADFTIGLSMTALVSSLGAAVAVVAVTSYFLRFLKKQRLEQKQVLERFLRSQSESQQRFQDQLDRQFDRNERLQEHAYEQLNQIVEEQNAILHEALEMMKAIEKNMTTSSATVQAILKTIDSLRPLVSALESLVCPKTGAVERLGRPVEEGAS
jgi:hypothetical protein